MDGTRDGGLARTGDAGVEMRELRRGDLPAAVEVIARGMRDNPVHLAAYGTDPDRRLRYHARLVRALLEAMPTTHVVGATQHGTLVAVAAAAPAGACQPRPRQRLRMLPHLAHLDPRAAVRVCTWISAWAGRDLAEAHVHLGPVAVDASLQGQGFGTILLREHCRRLDETGQTGYLETDKPANVVFYRRFGYDVVGEADVIGVPTWFMRRPATGIPH